MIKLTKKSNRLLTDSRRDSVSSVHNVVTLHRRPTIERAVEPSRNHDRVLMTVARNSDRTRGPFVIRCHRRFLRSVTRSIISTQVHGCKS